MKKLSAVVVLSEGAVISWLDLHQSVFTVR